MSWLKRWRNTFRPERLDHELEDEFAHHLAEAADRLETEGVTHEEALRISKLRLGNYSIQKEKTREMNIALWLDQTRADVLYGLRQLRMSPGFTAVAVISLALGVGANTAIFQLVNAIRLKTLPVEDPQRLVIIKYQQPSHRSGWGSGRNVELTYAQFQQMKEYGDPFSGMFAFSGERFNLAKGGEPRFAEGLYASGDFFRVLGVPAVLGRTFSAQDDSESSCNAGAVISYAFWQREFGGDAQALGRKLSLDGYPVPVIGVAAPGFFGVEVGVHEDVIVPMCSDRLISERSRIPLRYAWWLSIIGRLKPGWTLERASGFLRAKSRQIMQATMPAEYNPSFAKLFLTNKLYAADASNGVSGLRREYEQPLYVLLAISGLVLLIACANLANLLLARATARETEIAVRLAIGAYRRRLVRQFLVESLLLASFGTLLGCGLAVGLSRSLVALISSSQNQISMDTGMDWRVLGFAAGLAVLTCLLFGLLPALRATRLSPVSAMRAAGRTVTTTREGFSLRRALVVTQVALSLVLLAGALLFVRSFRNLLTTDPGFQAKGILAVGVDFGKARIAADNRLSVYKDLREKFSTVPGVLSVGQVDLTPMGGGSWDENVGIGGEAAATSHKQGWFNYIGPGYFHTMETHLLAGRDFDEHDTAGSKKVAIVNEQFATQFLRGKNPLGQTFRLETEAGKPEPVFEIVGLVQNTKYEELREDFRPIGFFPVSQNESPRSDANFMLRIAGSTALIARSVKARVAEASPSMGVEIRPFSAQIADSLLRDRLMATLSASFGFLAALLATLGLYGVIAYMVARRQKEIGIRMALGSARAGVIKLVLREAVALLAIGLSVGVAISLWAGRLAQSMLFGVKPRDLLSLSLACGLLGAIALLASYLPARRAAAADPMTALRIE
ncbi:MAG: ABC transporter permease [Acidobacteriaceae bacterium]|nr:ABC transporter permease [Acidobacteriaceae bacterium]